MKQVTVRVTELILKITENRDKHRGIFLRALEAWKSAVIAALEKAVAEAKGGRAYKTYFNLPKPEDHTEEYDRAIAMLQMSAPDTVTIEADDFRHLVLDDWGWMKEFMGMTSMYLGGAPASPDDETP